MYCILREICNIKLRTWLKNYNSLSLLFAAVRVWFGFVVFFFKLSILYFKIILGFFRLIWFYILAAILNSQVCKKNGVLLYCGYSLFFFLEGKAI